MAAVPVTISNAKITNADGSVSEPQTITGDLSLSNYSVGGGPIIPPDLPDVKPPPGDWKPMFPIVLPPGTPPFEPSAPGGYPPMIGGGPIIPPPEPPKPEKPPLFIPVWLPDYGWIMIPGFPIPAPSKKK